MEGIISRGLQEKNLIIFLVQYLRSFHLFKINFKTLWAAAGWHKYSVISSFILWLLISKSNQFWFPTLLKIWMYLIYQLVCLDWFVNIGQMNQLLSAEANCLSARTRLQLATPNSSALLSVLFPPSVFLLLKKGSQATALVTFTFSTQFTPE